jgi:hypothetical protein
MFAKLLSSYHIRENLPVDVQEVARFLIEKCGCQDSIIFHPEVMEIGALRGMYLQYTTRPGVYAAPELETLIIYPSNEPPEWQRMICAKELIHVCDGKSARTNSAQEVDDLIDKLLGPLSTDDYGLADLMASVDRIALYQALAILFPWGAREIALAKIANGVTEQQIASWAELPMSLVKLVLSEAWAELYAIIEEMQ